MPVFWLNNLMMVMMLRAMIVMVMMILMMVVEVVVILAIPYLISVKVSGTWDSEISETIATRIFSHSMCERGFRKCLQKRTMRENSRQSFVVAWKVISHDLISDAGDHKMWSDACRQDTWWCWNYQRRHHWFKGKNPATLSRHRGFDYVSKRFTSR